MTKRMIVVTMEVVLCAAAVKADTFGTGANQFNIDFVTISGATNPASGWGIVNNDYRMGVYEITNDQWDKFKTELGVSVTGDPEDAYDEAPTFTGTDVPTNNVSWYEAAQFVNYLNTSTGHQAAYNFYETTPGDPATLVFNVWTEAEAAGGTNLYRHKDAVYFLPTEDEWYKAAYWNGTSLQTYATPSDTAPVSGADSNYGQPVTGGQPWNVGSGSEELNGTFDMMGNIYEWMESPYSDVNYGTGSNRSLRGGSYPTSSLDLSSQYRTSNYPYEEYSSLGFRIASEVPEPCSLGLLTLGGLVLMKGRRG